MNAFLQFLSRAWTYFRGTKRVWRKPPRANLLIIDRGTASPLDEMFAHHNPHIMDIRGESVNMLALFRALPKIHLGAVAYLEAYIDFVKPKLILSRTDNNHTLWQLKRRPKVTYQVALIQNGWRLDYEDSLPKVDIRKDYQTDKFFTFGEASSKIFRMRLKGDVTAVGSLLANTVLRSRTWNQNSPISFISTFRASKHENYLEGSEFFGILGNLCRKFEKTIVIAGCEPSQAGHDIERKFYSDFFIGLDWQISRRGDKLRSY